MIDANVRIVNVQQEHVNAMNKHGQLTSKIVSICI